MGPAMPEILVFDSGLGGLSVFREIVAARPDAGYLYVADDAFFPYGDHSEAELIEHVPALIGGLLAAHRFDLVVIACNTASTIVLPALRARFDVPFVGTVPAIKPACATSRSRFVSVLGTEATVKREYTQALIRDFGRDCEVTLVGSRGLASIAEAALRDEPVDDAAISVEIGPCFVEANNRRTDVVVLACTHYPLLIDRLRRLAPWPVDWLDPAPAIAARVVDLLGPTTSDAPGTRRVAFTSGRRPDAALATTLSRYGLKI
jgi:glutamate racemase